MFLIAGLGNPGDQYANTRHNVGFMVIDKMAKDLTLSTNINKSNFIAQVIKSSNNLLVKPQTFMNNSGQSVVAIKDYYKIELENALSIVEEFNQLLNENGEDVE